MRQNYFFGGISKGILGSIKNKIPKPRSFEKDDGFKKRPRLTPPKPIQPGPSIDPVRPRPIGPITPQIDPYNRDYGFNQYGFDTDLLNYLNRQKQASFIDAGIGYNYDPKTKTFSGGSMVNQYKNIPLSVLQQVATSGDRNLLNQYITGGRGFNQPPMQPAVNPIINNGPLPKDFGPPRMVTGPDGTLIQNPIFGAINPGMQQPIPRDYGSGNQLPPGSTGFPKQPQQPIPRDYGSGNQLPPGLMGQTGMVGAQPQLINPVRPGVQQQAPLQQQAFSYGGRAGYEMGGLGSLQTNFGQSLQVPQQPNFGQPMFNFTGNSIASNPLLNYGQTPLTMADGGTTRSNYQEGGSTDFYNNQEPIFPRIENIGSLLDQAEQSIGQSKDNFNSPLATTFSRFGMQEGGMSMDQIMQPQMQDQAMMQGAGNDEQGQTAILTIIQLLIEQGIDPETAKELAIKILEAFAQGGEPAVEAFANQLEQEEQMQMMAGGGIAGYAQRQGYIFGGIGRAIGKVVGGIGKAIKSVVKSPIGQIALAIAAPYAISGLGALATGAGFTGLGSALSGFSTLGGTGFLGSALRSGLTNSLIQAITTGKIDPKQALISGVAGGAISSIGSSLSGGINPDVGGLTDANQPLPSVTSNLANTFSPPNIQPNIPTNTGYTGFESGVESMIAPKTSYAYVPDISKISMDPAAASNTSLVMNAKQPSFFENITNQAQQFGTNLMKDPLKTIGTGIQSLYDKTNLKDVGTGFLLAEAIRPQGVNESDEDYQEYLKNRNAEVKKYYDLYSGSLNPPLVLAATGGRIGYEYGSIPIGEPRRNPAGIMEIDYRKKGGFVPPIGIKEKADDIPAMLSNNEFVFTANAVRNAGGGDVNKGAERMYSLMKNLEAGGRV